MAACCLTSEPMRTCSLLSIHSLTRDREEIQALFDVQIQGILGQIKDQLDWMQRNGKMEQVVSNCEPHQLNFHAKFER
jgi:hypothetical protein